MPDSDEKLVNVCPRTNEFYFPILHVLSNGDKKTRMEIREGVATYMRLSEQAKSERTRGGGGSRFRVRTSRITDVMRKIGFIDSPDGRIMQITAKGLDAIRANPSGFNNEQAIQMGNAYRAENHDFSFTESGGQQTKTPISSEPEIEIAPEDSIDNAISILENDLASDILESLKRNSPGFLERVAVELLEAMNYGTGRVVGGSGDGGIDGIVVQDHLGLDRILIQAKRHEANIAPKDIQAFSGSLSINQATKGVFVTTGDFSRQAKTEAEKDKRIVLIDGKKLAELMVEHEVGCETETTIKIKKLDDDYFPE